MPTARALHVPARPAHVVGRGTVRRYTDGPDGRGYYLQQEPKQEDAAGDYDEFQKAMQAMGAVPHAAAPPQVRRR